jgi:hypothetical protein
MEDDLTLVLPARYRVLLDDQVIREIACMPGWWIVLDNVCQALQCYLDAHHVVPAITVIRVKEKWGGLRIYYRGGDEVCRGIVNKAMEGSLTICEVCGGEGKRIGKRRYRVRCPTHATWSTAAF